MIPDFDTFNSELNVLLSYHNLKIHSIDNNKYICLYVSGKCPFFLKIEYNNEYDNKINFHICSMKIKLYNGYNFNPIPVKLFSMNEIDKALLDWKIYIIDVCKTYCDINSTSYIIPNDKVMCKIYNVILNKYWNIVYKNEYSDSNILYPFTCSKSNKKVRFNESDLYNVLGKRNFYTMYIDYGVQVEPLSNSFYDFKNHLKNLVQNSNNKFFLDTNELNNYLKVSFINRSYSLKIIPFDKDTCISINGMFDLNGQQIIKKPICKAIMLKNKERTRKIRSFEAYTYIYSFEQLSEKINKIDYIISNPKFV